MWESKNEWKRCEKVKLPEKICEKKVKLPEKKVKLPQKYVRKLNCLKKEQNWQIPNFHKKNTELPGKGQFRLKICFQVKLCFQKMWMDMSSFSSWMKLIFSAVPDLSATQTGTAMTSRFENILCHFQNSYKICIFYYI